jgi:hypothetical protein
MEAVRCLFWLLKKNNEGPLYAPIGEIGERIDQVLGLFRAGEFGWVS